MNGRTDILVREAREVLEWDILKFWAGMQDPRGGFYGSIAPDLTADKEAVREEQLNARILWAYSNAYRRFRKREYLMPAMNAKDYFIQHFLDHKYGGAFTSVDSLPIMTRILPTLSLSPVRELMRSWPGSRTPVSTLM